MCLSVEPLYINGSEKALEQLPSQEDDFYLKSPECEVLFCCLDRQWSGFSQTHAIKSFRMPQKHAYAVTVGVLCLWVGRKDKNLKSQFSFMLWEQQKYRNIKSIDNCKNF